MNVTNLINKNVVDRKSAIDSYLKNRRHTQMLFDLLQPETYYDKPIPLRHPIVFYEGHIPAFSVNCFLRKGLGQAGINHDLEILFARGIDPSDFQEANRAAIKTWPERTTVQQYAREADQVILEMLASATLEDDAKPALCRGQSVFTMLEHEIMHQETLLYMWHRLSPDQKKKPANMEPPRNESAPKPTTVHIPAGKTTLGSQLDEIPFGWDNEFPEFVIDEVPAFEIDVYNVTNQDFLDFIEAGGYLNSSLWSQAGWRRLQATQRLHPMFWERISNRWMWRGMFGLSPLPHSWPVYVTHDEAAAYARWKGQRLPTEAEFHRAAYGTPNGTEQLHPWGEAEPSRIHGNFDFRNWDPVSVGSYPAGASAWGVHDLVGNGWEWTSTVFNGFPGFQTMASYPEYSSDFFDDDHYVVKGASQATGRELIRRSFRNWFRPDYPYMYASFRCTSDAESTQ